MRTRERWFNTRRRIEQLLNRDRRFGHRLFDADCRLLLGRRLLSADGQLLVGRRLLGAKVRLLRRTHSNGVGIVLRADRSGYSRQWYLKSFRVSNLTQYFTYDKKKKKCVLDG